MSEFTTNLSYDKCHLNKKNSENTNTFDLLVDKNIYDNDTKCYQASSNFMQNPFNSIPGKYIDIENDLKNMINNNSLCPENKFNPQTQRAYQTYLNDCKKEWDLSPDYTRLNKACNITNGLNMTNRYYHPLVDEIKDYSVYAVASNTISGKNTRTELKNYIDNKKQRQTFITQN
jgi:hypothetical protein